MQTLDDSWLPTDDYGVIDRLGPESIVTSFYRVLLPIWPEHSAYVIRCDDGSERRIKIPLQPRSVLLGYLRAPSWLAGLILALPALMLPERWSWLLGPAVVLVVLAAVLSFVAGRLPEPEVLRRSLLKRVIGFGAPPELLTEALREEVRTNLELMWHTRSPRIGWLAAIEAGDASELLVALAEYHQDPDALALAQANFDNKLWN